MRFILISVDFSRKGRLIRKIRPDEIHAGVLEDVAHMMKVDSSNVSVDGVQETWTRFERALETCRDTHMSGLLNDILRDARWQVQSSHRQYSYK